MLFFASNVLVLEAIYRGRMRKPIDIFSPCVPACFMLEVIDSSLWFGWDREPFIRVNRYSKASCITQETVTPISLERGRAKGPEGIAGDCGGGHPGMMSRRVRRNIRCQKLFYTVTAGKTEDRILRKSVNDGQKEGRKESEVGLWVNLPEQGTAHHRCTVSHVYVSDWGA